MDNPNQQAESKLSQQKQPAARSANKSYWIIIGIALILIAAIWVWKSVEMTKMKKAAQVERQALKEEAKRQIALSHEEHLKLLAKPFVWAVRTEMMQGNISQVNLYMNDLVKEKNFQSIAVINSKGIIISSTNKKDEGKAFSTIGKDTWLSSNNTAVENVNDSLLLMASPIMGFNNRLGTLFIKYSIQSPEFN